MRYAALLTSVALGTLWVPVGSHAPAAAAPGPAAPARGALLADAEAQCTALAQATAGGAHIVSARFNPAGPIAVPPGPGGPPPAPVAAPAHCEIVGMLQERTGADGQHYAIRFHLRLPADWNGRFFMQGGGGSNGELGDALGRTGPNGSALVQGYAVLSQDSGHDNATNAAPAKGGMTAFGFDAQARANYGNASLPLSVAAAKALIGQFYGAAPSHSYFVGCSKGGQEGMMLAQRYPGLFDGIVAAAPGMSLPRAAVAEAWDTQAFASAAAKPLTMATLAASFSDSDLKLVRKTILDSCDAADGVTDGLVSNFGACTSARVVPALRAIACKGGKQDSCLAPAQVDALVRVHDGPRDSKGKALYAAFPWDAGWSDFGWRIWKTGSADGRIPALNVALGANSLAMVFTTPPSMPAPGLDGALAFSMGFDFDRDVAKIYATAPGFPNAAWTDVGARSPDLAAFRARGGKLIVPQGVSDPVFSIEDTIDWWRAVNARMGGQAAQTVRVFPVPGMGHCAGGPATDQYDAFAALVDWVEKGKAPGQILASAGPMSPWPGRSRPLCPYPEVAWYKGEGDVEKAENFVCRAPGTRN